MNEKKISMAYTLQSINNAKKEQPQKPKSFLEEFLHEYGIKEEENSIQVIVDEDECREKKQHYFSSDRYGNIQILYPTLEGGVFTYETDSKSNPTQILYNTRLKKPIEKDGKTTKYKFPYKAEQQPFFTKNIIQKFKNSTQINTLFIVEGEKKAFLLAKFGVDAIAIQGIHGWIHEKGSKKIHYEIEKLLNKCRPRNVVLLFDADALYINYDEKKNLSDRPTQFHSSVMTFSRSLEPFLEKNTIIRAYFLHVNTDLLKESKGVDDLLLFSPKEQTNILEDLRLLRLDGEYFRGLCLTSTSEKNIKSYFGLQDAQNFHKVYEKFIGKNKFIFKNTTYTFEDGFLTFDKSTFFSDYEFVFNNELNALEESVTPEERKQWQYDVRKFGFITTKLGYFRAIFFKKPEDKDKVEFQKISNFTLKILYHVSAGLNNKRVIELKNDRGMSKSLAIDTKQLTSPSLFKEMVEGQGNFQFFGKPSDIDRLKAKLFEEERPCVQVETLGWQTDGFFAFSNGIYANQQFCDVDTHGIVSFNDKNFLIPYGVEKNPMLFLNEKKFRFQQSSIEFSEWAKLYCNAFGDAGKIVLIFSISCLFSDIIFLNQGNYPMIFLYGEGGSGKSKLASFAQCLWGQPQPALKLSEPANTAKAKIRKLAQFVNSLAVMEEFINNLETSVIKTLTGIYDRFGYEKASMMSFYGTETVPINSGVIITGNQYPNDDPLLQRLILIDYNKNEHTSEETENYSKLKRINEVGISNVLTEILPMREYFNEKFSEVFSNQYRLLKEKAKNLRTTDRMIENYSLILTVFEILHEKLDFPFNREDLEIFLLQTLKSHSEKRVSGSDVQHFWDIFYQGFCKSEIVEQRDFVLYNETIAIKLKDVYPFYQKTHYELFRNTALNQVTLREKLKSWDGFIEHKDSYRSLGGTSCLVFNYSATGMDIEGRKNWINNV